MKNHHYNHNIAEQSEWSADFNLILTFCLSDNNSLEDLQRNVNAIPSFFKKHFGMSL